MAVGASPSPSVVDMVGGYFDVATKASHAFAWRGRFPGEGWPRPLSVWVSSARKEVRIKTRRATHAMVVDADITRAATALLTDPDYLDARDRLGSELGNWFTAAESRGSRWESVDVHVRECAADLAPGYRQFHPNRTIGVSMLLGQVSQAVALVLAEQQVMLDVVQHVSRCCACVSAAVTFPPKTKPSSDVSVVSVLAPDVLEDVVLVWDWAYRTPRSFN